ncbi:unnamed protein product, partial [Onchocerca flexuosa]|uniref:Ovule protein n=1 Tax=Onchocerca flexuosa TaxID=387005 RepID=A0A183HLP4_9BILA
QSNFSNKFSLAIKVAATSQLLLLTTAATPPSQDRSSFGLETNDLRSFSPTDFSTNFSQQTPITTNDISRGKGSTFPGTLPLEQQEPQLVTFQNVQQNSEGQSFKIEHSSL